MSTDTRAHKAFIATRALEIPDAKARRVLKHLLKVYDKKWELIEAENYRLLLDACFELDEQKEENGNKQGEYEGNNDDSNDSKQCKKQRVEGSGSGIASRMKELAQMHNERGWNMNRKFKSDCQPKSQNISCRRDHMSSPTVAASGASGAIKASDGAKLPKLSSQDSSSARIYTITENLGNPGDVRQLILHEKKYSHITDITKGTERVKISLEDSTGTEDLPTFTYIPENLVYQNAYLHVNLARISDEDCCSSCCGNCLSASLPCICARETGGEFAYTKNGLLKEKFLDACISMEREPEKHPSYYCQDCPLERTKDALPGKCRGHLIKKFIKECWRKCGCNMNCGNRVVQRGIRCMLQVYSTPEGKGWGLRTLEKLSKGAFVCEYVGEIVTNMELYKRNMERIGSNRHTYPVYLDADWGSEKVLEDDEALCLDATLCGNVARFINHRCGDANLISIPVEIETPDRHYYHIALFTTREVCAKEELTWDYNIDFGDLLHPIKAFSCCCGSKFCRDRQKPVDRKGLEPNLVRTKSAELFL